MNRADLLIQFAMTIAELQFEVDRLNKENSRLAKQVSDYHALMDGHPGMCCGRCSSAIMESETEVERLRGILRSIYGVLTSGNVDWDRRLTRAVEIIVEEAENNMGSAKEKP